ncbi:hypothetical protein BJ170DRAFT_604880 [Xylariales sp. AK1849]|nr:hypothetical protein BJ170DRAFT_604880 [Xylariales sp. AK1849]
MASFMDLMSSPDPLVDDEPPSAMRPVTRRMARHHQAHPQSSSLSVPNSTPARALSTGKSPRKQTFELDVGDERSPQKILVTVEADGERRARSSGINRRLFTSSPTRSTSRRRETTMTTTVPLRGLTDDEGGDDFGSEATPRRRGRPVGSKNGTPNPRGKKRAGTPLRKTPRVVRQRNGDAGSEAALFSDALVETDINTVGEPTPKPKPRTRKTPKKTGTPAVPSSKPTGRKRGRPRKALEPEEVAVLTSEAADRAEDADMLPNEDASLPGFAPYQRGPFIDVNEAASEDKTAQDDGIGPTSSPLPEDTIQGLSYRTEQHRLPGTSHSPDPIGDLSVHGHRAHDHDAPMTDDYMGEPHSDLESEAEGNDGITYSGQDNLTHASDFSMIAVESLPSFQASFQSNRSGPIEEEHPDFEDAGDETNMIINQTLEELRRSTQSAQGEADAEPNRDAVEVEQYDLVDDRGSEKDETEDLSANQISPAPAKSSPARFGSSPQAWQRSPRRQKPLPLSRQLFAGKAPHIDDSFSSIPDDVLQAATPGRLPMKTASANVANRDASIYDDSFSEIPEQVLKAATPRVHARSAKINEEDGEDFSEIPEEVLEAATPAQHTRTTRYFEEAGDGEEEVNDGLTTPEQELPSASRSTNIGSSRLPTPDDTNSSTAGSKNAPDEDTQAVAAAASTAPNTSDPNIRSSPPAGGGNQLTVNIESDILQPNRDITDLPSRQSSSPQLPQTKSETPKQAKSLQPPARNQRPSLSPIVRVGRTLQSVMTDRSSPEGHESSLGSPFRGSGQNDSRQSSVTKSPTREAYSSTNQSKSQNILHPIASFAQSIRSSFASSQRQVPAPSIIGQVEDPFGPDMHDYSQTESLRRSAYGTANNEAATQPAGSNFFPSVTSSTRAAPPSDDEMSWVADQSSPATQRSRRLSASQQQFGSANSSLFGTRGSNSNRLMDIEDKDDEDHEVDQDQQEPEDHGEVEQDDQSVEEQEEEPSNDSYEADENDNEGDIWDIEASRPTPKSTKVLRAEAQARRDVQPRDMRPALAPTQPNGDPPRRSKIPSPWRRSTRRLIYQDEFRSPSQIEVEADSPISVVEGSAPILEDIVQPEIAQEIHQQRIQDKGQVQPQEHIVQPAETEDYSMVAQQKKHSAPVLEKPPSKKGLFGTFDIMSFFSSPAPLPKNNALQSETNKTPVPQAVTKPLPPQPVQSVEKPLPEEPQSALRATGLFPSIPQKTFRPSPERRVDLFSPGIALRSNDTVPDTYADSPSTPERQGFPSIPQKRNFTPLSGQSRNTASLFTPSKQGSTPGDMRTPSPEPDYNLLQPYSDEEPYPGEESSSMLADGPSFEQLPPREKPSTWDKNLSPTKSCLRSPLKPRTPGRVVEFTNTALGPVALVGQRALGVSIGAGNNSTLAPGPALAMVPEDKENTPSPPKSPERTLQPHVSSMYRPPAAATTASKATSTSSLSQTTWTKPHWIRLDELLQLRRRDPMRFQQLSAYPTSIPTNTVNTHPSTSSLSRKQSQHPLLGKEVTAGETKMVLEPWHLEVVEAFRAEVGGWDAKTLSKRLFALLVGEERRKRERAAARAAV